MAGVCGFRGSSLAPNARSSNLPCISSHFGVAFIAISSLAICAGSTPPFTGVSLKLKSKPLKFVRDQSARASRLTDYSVHSINGWCSLACGAIDDYGKIFASLEMTHESQSVISNEERSLSGLHPCPINH